MKTFYFVHFIYLFFYYENETGVNMPGLSVDLPAMSEKDKQDIRWGIKNDVRHALIFILMHSDEVLLIYFP